MIINATPHAINIYHQSAFVNLEQLNPTTWVADAVDEDKLILNVDSTGIARIAVVTTEGDEINGIPTVQTVYGELTGIPELNDDDIVVVSLPTQSAAKSCGHPLASRMATPYKVVRQRNNTSTVLGCMGLSFQ